MITPESYSEAVRALRHGPRQQVSREVYLTHDAAKRHTSTPHFKVQGPTAPGTELRVYVSSGFFCLDVLSGNVRITTASSWGNSLTVYPPARDTTTCHIPAAYKVHVQGIPLASVTGDTTRLFHSPDLPAYLLQPAASEPVKESVPF